MRHKPTREELEQRVKELERELAAATRGAEDLRRERDFLSGALDLLPDLFAVFRTDGRCLRWNRALTEVSGYSDEETSRMRVIDLFEEREHVLVRQKMQEVERTGSAAVELSLRTKDGRLIPYEFRGGLLRDERGNALGFCGIGRDITERKRAAEALRESEERFRALFVGSLDAVFLADPESGVILDANPAASELLLRPYEQIVGLHYTQLHPSRLTKYASEKFAEAVRDMLLHPVELQILRSDGSEKPVEISAQLIQIGGTPVWHAVFRDITQRKEAEAALQDRLETWKVFFNAIPDVAAMLDRNGYLLEANRALAQRLGRSVDELVGRRPGDFIPGEVVIRRQSFLDKVIHSGGPVRFEDERNGTWFDNILSPVLDGQGNVTGVALIARDVTSNKLSSQALEASEKRYRAVVDNQTELIARFLPDGRQTFVNDAYCRYFGKQSGDLVDRSFMPLIPEEDHRMLEEQLASISAQNPAVTVEHRVFRGDGEVRWMQWTNQGICDDEGNIVEYQSVGRDIHERRLTEEALRESEERFRAVFEGSMDAIFLADPESGIIQDANPAAGELLQMPLEEMVGLHQSQVHPPRMRQYARERFSQIAHDADLFVPTKTTVLCSDGTEKTCEIMAQVIQINGKPMVLGEFRDITDREQTERELLKEKALTDAIFDSVPGVIYLVDEQGSFVRWNSRFEEVTGYSGHEVARMRYLDFCDDEEKARVVQQVREVFTSGRAEAEATVLTKSGAAIPFYFTAVAIEIEGKRYDAGVGIDITARKQAEEAHRESLRISRALLDSIQDIAMLLDANGCILAANEVLAKRHGKHPEELVGLSLYDLLPPEVAELRMSVLRQVLESGRVTRYEDEYEEPLFDTVYCPVFEEHGRVTKVAVLARDITEQKRNEERLRESMGTWRVFFNALPMVAALVDTREHLIEANEAFARRFGRQADELPGTYVWDLLPPDLAGTRKTYGDRVVQSRQPVRFQDERRGAWFDNVVFPFLDEQGEVTKVAVLAQDITEEKRAREALEASEQRYRAVVENQTELICRTLPDATFTFVNGACCRYLGMSSDELVGKRYTPFILEEDRRKVEESFASISPQNPMATIEHRVLAPDGTIRWHQWTNQGIFDAQGHLVEYQSVGRDITERKQLEKEILKLEKLDSLGVLAGGIAHDFNNILTAIAASISMVQTFGELPEDLSEMLADAGTAVRRARNLTQQLLTFSRGGTPVRKPMPISEVVRNTAGFALSGSNVRCDFSLPEDLWLGDIDEGQISQVIQNLVINAKQAMPEGGTIRVSAENVEIRETGPVPLRRGRYIRLSVQDQGTGIPEKHLSKIFDPFFTTKHEGSGLGLSICFSIVKGHEGHIHADSVMGVGTTFHVYLPAAEEAGGREAKAQGRPQRGEGRILLVDDEELVLSSAGAILARLGYEVEWARDGKDGVTRYEAAMKSGNPFTAVILDLTIPGGMGGREAVRELKRMDPQVRAIASSGYSNDPVLSDYKAFGFSGVLTKPYGVGEFGEVLHRVIRNDRSENVKGDH